jgi:hypothetical protein
MSVSHTTPARCKSFNNTRNEFLKNEFQNIALVSTFTAVEPSIRSHHYCQSRCSQEQHRNAYHVTGHSLAKWSLLQKEFSKRVLYFRLSSTPAKEGLDFWFEMSVAYTDSSHKLNLVSGLEQKSYSGKEENTPGEVKPKTRRRHVFKLKQGHRTIQPGLYKQI